MHTQIYTKHICHAQTQTHTHAHTFQHGYAIILMIIFKSNLMMKMNRTSCDVYRKSEKSKKLKKINRTVNQERYEKSVREEEPTSKSGDFDFPF